MTAAPGVDDGVESAGWLGGFRIGAGMAIGAFALAISFGAYAVTNGWPPWLAIVMSTVVFSGSAQFALVTAMSGGGAVAAGIGAAALINTRFIPMAIASARGLRGGPFQRALEGQGIVDASFVAAQRPNGTLDREKMLGATLVQWPSWIAGTAIGALFAPSTEFMHTYALDVIFPAFFLVLLLEAVRHSARLRVIAIVALAIGAVASYFLPGGVALLVCAAAALIGAVRTRGRAE